MVRHFAFYCARKCESKDRPIDESFVIAAFIFIETGNDFFSNIHLSSVTEVQYR